MSRITGQRLTPCLWFDDQAEEAVAFYTSVFPNSKTSLVTRYPEAGQEIHGRRAGSVMTIAFELDGHAFTALNGGPHFKFNEAVSLQVYCDTQQEIDHYWEKLGAGGDPAAQQCGWLKDRFGLSWQIVPRALVDLLASGDAKTSAAVMNAVLRMKKIDLREIQRAAAG